MSKAHFDAFEALIPDSVRVFRGSAPFAPAASDYPYVVLGGNPGREYTEAQSGDPDSIDVRFKLTYSSLSFDSVLIIMNIIRAAVISSRLVVPGWTCGLFRHDSLIDVTTDFAIKVPDVDANPVFAVDEFALTCTR